MAHDVVDSQVSFGTDRPVRQPLVDEGRIRSMLDACVQCGRCLPSCPTYRVLEQEADSPRGRVWLMRTLWDDRVSPLTIGVDAESVEAHLRLCLDCRACETACPSDVEFSKLLDISKQRLEAERPPAVRVRLIRFLVLRHVFIRPRVLAAAAWLVHRTRPLATPLIARLARRSAAAGRISGLLDLVPMRSPSSDEPPQLIPAQGTHRANVALFTGCVMRAAFSRTNAATARVLSRNGIEVRVPTEQRCCGALHDHNGDHEGARDLARRNITVLNAAEHDAIVVNAAGCGAHLKSYGWLLRDDPIWAERAEAFASSVKDAAEYLAAVGLTALPGRLDIRVAYQDPCHLLHAQRIRSQPRVLLRAIPGLQSVSVGEPELCCGSAGSYNVTHPEVAIQLRTRKVTNVIRTGATVVVTANPGCLIQIEAGLRAEHSDVSVTHLMDLLDSAYERNEGVAR